MKNLIIVGLCTGMAIFAATSIASQIHISTLESALAQKDQASNPDWLWQHQREIWLANLEWCESQGIPSAVNPKDRDGTPSFGAFQFKPDTFRGYSKKYGLSGFLMDYESQKEILIRMLDDKDVQWSHEFPDCVSRLGKPPVKF